MTDTQIIKTIHEILTRLHDPKTGFNGYRNELRAKKLSRDEYMVATRDKISEMAAKHGMSNASVDEQVFSLTGRDIIENRHYRSCGHAAKAFCYLNSQLPDDRQLDIKILLSTNIDNLMDGMRGHTLPCVKMSDGKYHAFDPQIAPSPDGTVEFIKEDIVIGNLIHHILPSIAKYGRPYKVMDIVEPDCPDLLDFHKFLKRSIDKSPRTRMIRGIIGAIQKNITKDMTQPQSVYEFCRKLPKDSKLRFQVLVAYDDAGKTYRAIGLNLDNEWYFIPDLHWINLQKIDISQPVVYRGTEFHIKQILSPDEYMQGYAPRPAQNTYE